ncbi:MAG: hypothetical protein ACQGVC_01665 [Myxococcota bacterium]
MTEDASPHAALVRRHLVAGWTLLLLFLSLGIVLEVMHGFKIGWYLDTDQQTRRHLMTLAHAHGVLLALVQVAFAATLYLAPALDARAARWASPCLLCGALLMPAGFLLGGLFPYGGDPGLGVLLVPPSAALLFVGVALAARALWRLRGEPPDRATP